MLTRVIQVYRQSFSGLSSQSWALSLVILINRCASMAVPFMALYVTQALHRTAAEAGVIISLFGVGAIFGAMVGGKLTDMVGFRPVQIISSVLSGVFFLGFAWVDSYPILCALSVVISFFSEAFRPANYAAIASYAAPNTETRSYSLNRLATNIGWAVGLSMGGILASINYKLLFIVEGGVSVLVGLLILFLLPHKPKLNEAKMTVDRPKVLKPWQDIQFVRFWFLSLLFTSCFFLMFRVVPVFLKQVWHLDEALIGMILGLNGVIIALLEMIMVSKIENKRTPNFYMSLGVLIVAVAFAVLVLPKFVPLVLAVLSVVLFTFGEMFSLPFFNTFVVRRSNENNIGLYAAGYTLSWSVAQVLGPTLGFLIADFWGYNLLWILVTPVLVICAYFFKRLKFDS